MTKTEHPFTITIEGFISGDNAELIARLEEIAQAALVQVLEPEGDEIETSGVFYRVAFDDVDPDGPMAYGSPEITSAD